jgi:hypothetical protein
MRLLNSGSLVRDFLYLTLTFVYVRQLSGDNPEAGESYKILDLTLSGYAHLVFLSATQIATFRACTTFSCLCLNLLAHLNLLVHLNLLAHLNFLAHLNLLERL